MVIKKGRESKLSQSVNEVQILMLPVWVLETYLLSRLLLVEQPEALEEFTAPVMVLRAICHTGTVASQN